MRRIKPLGVVAALENEEHDSNDKNQSADHDRAPIDGVDVHHIEPEEITLEQQAAAKAAAAAPAAPAVAAPVVTAEDTTATAAPGVTVPADDSAADAAGHPVTAAGDGDGDADDAAPASTDPIDPGVEQVASNAAPAADAAAPVAPAAGAEGGDAAASAFTGDTAAAPTAGAAVADAAAAAVDGAAPAADAAATAAVVADEPVVDAAAAPAEGAAAAPAEGEVDAAAAVEVPAADAAAAPAEGAEAAAPAADAAPAAAGAEAAATVDDLNHEDHPMETVDSVEGATIELNEGEAEAEQSETMIEDAADVATSLESLAESLRAQLQLGGLNRHSAQLAKISTEHLYHQVGLQGVNFPALESFDTVSGRQRGTKHVLESIVQKVGDIVKRIIKAIMDSIQWLISRVKMAFSVAKKTGERAEKIAAAAKAINQGSPAEIVKGGFISHLMIGDQVTDLRHALLEINDGNQLFYSARTELFQALRSMLEAEETTGEGQKLLEAAAAPYRSLKKSFEFTAKDSQTHGANDAGIDKVLYVSSALPGNVIITVAVPGTNEGSHEVHVRQLADMRVLIQSNGHTPASELVGIKGMAIKDIVEISELVVEVCKHMQSYESQVNALASEKKAVVAKLNEFANAGEGPKAQLAQLGKLTMTLVDQPMMQWSKYALTTLRAVLDYCTVSLQAYAPAQGGQGADAASLNRQGREFSDAFNKDIANHSSQATRDEVKRGMAESSEAMRKAAGSA